MSKVKPQVGQIWKSNENGEKVGVLRLEENGVACFSAYSGKLLTTLGVFLSDFEFTPQNDLEWLAVNDVIVPSWAKFAYYSNHIDRTPKFSKIKFKSGKTQREIQNMRYKLGLDEKPRVSAEKWAEMLRDKRVSKLESLKCDLERRLQRYVGGDWTEMLRDKH